LDENPGNRIEDSDEQKRRFEFLKDAKIRAKLVRFENEEEMHMVFYLPQVHCSSCLYLLENLHKIQAGIKATKLNFSQKELLVIFAKKITSAFEIAQTLSRLGYEPYFSLSDIGGNISRPSVDRTRIYKLGVAGFAFGNIMLLSFPEYLANGAGLDGLQPYFQWLILLLIIPVISYSATEFYKLAWGGIKERYLNIDLPIVLAMGITLYRSLVEVFTHTGPGYFDSLSGIVFFMLLGRLLQDKTHKSITFNRDFSSYFPISSTLFDKGLEKTIALPEIQVNDELVIHNGELVPVDGLVVSGKALIDYSFVTGESEPVELQVGSFVYAGGRQMGASIRVLAQKTVSQSYLVSLWNKHSEKETSNSRIESTYVQKASMYFTLFVFLIAITAAIFWYINDPAKIWNAVTAVLIVACPCALLLSVTFTHGHFLSIFAKNGFYVRGAKVLEKLNEIDTIVFDKTGTLTDTQNPRITYHGTPLSAKEKDAVQSLGKESIHPYARKLASWLGGFQIALENIVNVPGMGVKALLNGVEVKLGNANFVNANVATESNESSKIWLAIGFEIKGYFQFSSALRPNLNRSLRVFEGKKNIAVLSGDSEGDRYLVADILPQTAQLYFNHKPKEKKEKIEKWKKKGHSILMLGDGLNDAGALLAADIGVAVAADISYFTPGSDAIILGNKLPQLSRFFAIAHNMRSLIWWSFAISIIYNIIGLSYAVTGSLNPIIASVLMPSSSISIVLFTWLGSIIIAKKEGLKT
jgi:Cu+-exporting ATPase